MLGNIVSSLIQFDVVVLVWLTETDCRANLLHLFIFKPLTYTILNMWQDKTWKVCEVFLAWQMIKTIQFISQAKTLFRPLFSKSLPLQTATILNWSYIYTLCHDLALQPRISHRYRSFLLCFRTHTQAVFFFHTALICQEASGKTASWCVPVKTGPCKIWLHLPCHTWQRSHTCPNTILCVVIRLHIKFSDYSLLSWGHIATPCRRCAEDADRLSLTPTPASEIVKKIKKKKIYIDTHT